jgi:acetyltransferase
VLRPASAAHGRSRFAIQPDPSELEEVIQSRSGTPFHLRPIRPEDEPALIRMVESSEPNDIRLRFFSAMRTLGHAFAARLTQIDYSREMAFVIQAERSADDDILGVARLIVDPNEEIAEFGIMVRSDQKGRGIGWMLMNAILAYARKRGFAEIYGEVLSENTTMLAMARTLGFVQKAHPDDVGLRKVVIRL